MPWLARGRRVAPSHSADRPERQRLLAYLAAEAVQYVVVPEVDRLARNRWDDVTITAAFQASGARLVSVTREHRRDAQRRSGARHHELDR